MDPEETFTCKFCFLIVLDPKECYECSSLFCSKCIKEYKDLTGLTKCANCMSENETNFQGNINRLVKNLFENLTFKCPYDDQCSFKGH